MLDYFTANTISETVCLIVAAICLANDRIFIWRGFILFLFITCLTDYYGLYVGRKTHNNHWIYNTFIIFESLFTFLVFQFLLDKNFKNTKVLILSALVIFYIFYLYGIFSHGFEIYNYLSYSILSLEFVLLSFFFYYLLLKDEQYVDLRFSSDFWWVAGTLFFYFANTACNLFYDRLYSVMITPKHHITYFIFKALNIILYSCWSYSFICRKWLMKKSEIL